MGFNSAYAKLQIDKTNRLALFSDLKVLDKERISAGIHRKEGSQIVGGNGVKLIDIAVQNEYGNEWVMPHTVRFQRNGKWYYIKKDTHIKIPATHFVGRLLRDQNLREYIYLVCITEIKDIFKNHRINNNIHGFSAYSKKDTVKAIGEELVKLIKKGIDNKSFEPNSPMTIEAKGFDKRLYDKGHLYDAIKFSSKKAKKSG